MTRPVTVPKRKTPILTPHRLRILNELASRKYLKMEQVYDLVDAKTDSQKRGTRRLLMLMAQDGLIQRKYVTEFYDSHGRPRGQNTHWLARRGREALGRGHIAPEKSPASLPHDTEITSFRLTLERALPEHVKLHWRQDDLRKTVNPDALFALEDTSKTREKSTVYFFLEIEKARQSLSRTNHKGLTAKLERYDKFNNSPKLEEYAVNGKWKFTRFRVVVVVKNEELQGNLLHRLSKDLPYSFIWVTTEQEYRNNISGPIFKTPKDFEQRSHSLIDG